MFVTTASVFLVVLFLEILRRRWSNFQYFKRRGIPGPTPHILWGHYRELRSDHVYWVEKWSKEYGETFGMFWGDKPFLVTRDLDLQSEVFIKQFSNFVRRSKQFGLEDSHPLTKYQVSVVDEKKWKPIRSAISPAFSTSKIREMEPLMLKSVAGFEKNLLERCSKGTFDVNPLLKRLTLDNICRTVLGVDANTQEQSNITSPFLKAALDAVEEFMQSFMDLVCNSSTFISKVFSNVLYYLLLWNILPHAVSTLSVELKKVLVARRKAAPRKDVLQFLMDKQSADEKKTDSKDEFKMTTEAVIGNSITMLLAGYDTTSVALGCSLYVLGKHPEIQQRLREEIMEALWEKQLDVDIATNLKYLDRFVREVLRLYPPATGFSTRQAINDTVINGKKVEAGSNFYFPVRLIHTDPAYWRHPLTFDPDRFLDPLAHNLAYQPFGDGPRNCVGMRLALVSIKLTLCRIVPRFEFKATDDLVFRGVVVVHQPREVKISIKEIR